MYVTTAQFAFVASIYTCVSSLPHSGSFSSVFFFFYLSSFSLSELLFSFFFVVVSYQTIANKEEKKKSTLVYFTSSFVFLFVCLFYMVFSLFFFCFGTTQLNGCACVVSFRTTVSSFRRLVSSRITDEKNE